MAEHDPRAFEDLFASEPAAPSGADMAAWIGPYERLVALLERHLEETRSFASSMPEPVRRYLHRENESILAEELERFRERLAYWRGLGAASRE